MYPHFIEVHSRVGGAPATINIDHIVGFCADYAGTIITTVGVKVEQVFCNESYDELKELIRNAGASINKGDPRLDQSKPLTMDDLKDMVGQPVWDSNRNVWYLFKTFDEDGQAHFTDAFGNTGIAESEDALIKYPIYRMVKND